MKRKIIAMICLAAMCLNLTVIAAEEENAATPEVTDQQVVTEVTEPEGEEAGNQEVKPEENDTDTVVPENSEIPIQPAQDEPKIIENENNKNLNILNEVELTTFSIDDSRADLKTLIDQVKASNPEDVAQEESFAALQTALTTAEAVYADSSADEQKIKDAKSGLQTAVQGLTYIIGQNILSNNTFADADKTKYYPEMQGSEPSLTVLATGAKYTYSDTSPTKPKDTQMVMLSNGLASGYMTVNNTADTVIVYDLGGEYFVDGTDVFTQFIYFGDKSTYRKNIKGFNVEISSDGVNYKTVSSASAKTTLDTGEATGTYVLKTPSAFAASSGRYVRITIKGDVNSTQYTLNEVVIKGFKSPFSRDDLYEALVKCAGADSSICTPESYSNYITAYHNAESVYWNEETTGRPIYDAKHALETAFAGLENNAVIKILSGNVVSSFDKDYYNGYALDTTNLSYTYQSDSNPQIVSQDSKCNILLQGGCDVLSTSSLVYGTWDNASPAKILFDMGEECYISGADVWEYYQGKKPRDKDDKVTSDVVSTRAGWVRISVSSDGVNFTQVSEKYNPKTDEDNQVANVIGQDFDVQKCRYVLVTVEKSATSHQITLNEVVLRGYRSGIKANAPYNFGILDYKNSSDTRIISLDGNDSVTVSGKINSNTKIAKNVIVVTAAYNQSNNLIDYGFTSVNIGAYGVAEFENTLQLNGESGLEIYNFVWDSMENGLALSQQKKFGTL